MVMADCIEMLMPIKATPFEHQKRAFAFAMMIFDVFEKGGDMCGESNGDVRPVRSSFPKAEDRNA